MHQQSARLLCKQTNGTRSAGQVPPNGCVCIHVGLHHMCDYRLYTVPTMPRCSAVRASCWYIHVHVVYTYKLEHEQSYSQMYIHVS